MRVGLYTRTATWDRSVLSTQMQALEKYVHQCGWQSVICVEEIGFETIHDRPKRKVLSEAAQRKDIDVVVVWRLDCWARSTQDLINTLKELGDAGVGFVSLTEPLDLTTDMGHAMASLLEVFVGFERTMLDSIKNPV
jgi:putative DNA-invertase from lambdoid prophage Rac